VNKQFDVSFLLLYCTFNPCSTVVLIIIVTDELRYAHNGNQKLVIVHILPGIYCVINYQ